jgi:mannose/fructose/N-acetylgalactosamine-specific phosphotransferase system component IID
MLAFYILSAFGVPIVCALGLFFAFDGNPYLGLIPMLVLAVIFGIIMVPLRKRVFVKGDRRIRTLRF